MEFVDFVGFVGILINIYNAMYGKTTVTPGYALHNWRNDSYGWYSNIQFGKHKKVSRFIATGVYAYEYKVLQPDGTYKIDTNPFANDVLKRLSYQCNLSTTNANGALEKTIFNELEEFTVIVFHAAPVVKSGLWPPSAPYPIQIKCDADKLKRGCTEITPYHRGFTTEVGLYDSGYSLTQIGFVNYQYSWPPIVWCGEFYEH